MKVLFYHKNLNAGGAERAVVEVVEHLRKEGVQAALLAGREVGDYLEGLAPDSLFRPVLPEPKPNSWWVKLQSRVMPSRGNISQKRRATGKRFVEQQMGAGTWHSLSERLERMLSSNAIERVIEGINQYKPDVVVSSLIETGHTLIALALASGEIQHRDFQWVTVEQNNTHKRFIDYYESPQREAWEEVAKWVYERSDRVVAVSGGVRDGLVKRYGIQEGKVDIIYNPVSIQKVQSATGTAHSELPTQRPFLLNAGRLHSQKNQTVLIKAFSRVADTIDADLCIAGSGKLHDHLLEVAKQCGVSDRVHLLGVRSDLWDLMKQARAFVLSSDYEGFPLVLIESIAARCPVISFDCDFGPRELIEDGITGRLIEPGNGEQLAQAMKSACEDTDQSARFAAAAFDRLGSFSVEQTASGFRHAFENMMREPSIHRHAKSRL